MSTPTRTPLAHAHNTAILTPTAAQTGAPVAVQTCAQGILLSRPQPCLFDRGTGEADARLHLGGIRSGPAT